MIGEQQDQGDDVSKGYQRRSTKYNSEKIEYDSNSSVSNSSNSNSKIEPGYLENGRTGSINLQEGTQRGLESRHIQMIALGGCIGTGLFLNMGVNVAEAGPAGSLIAYIVIGFMVYCVMTALGEMASFIPVSGSFNHYATRFVDPALGFALGWNYWSEDRGLTQYLSRFFSSKSGKSASSFNSGVSIAAELSAAATIIDWWKAVLPDAAWSSIFLVMIVVINVLSVKIFGEVEYYLSMVKILLVLVFLIIAILVSTGAVGGPEPIGFKYWIRPGPFANDGVGTVSVLLSAGFSYMGTEVVGVTAGEAKNPVKAIPRAIKNTFYRIILFYIFVIFLIGLCIPYDNPDLANDDGSPNSSAFTLVFKLAGIDAGAHVINAVVLTSVLSAANSSVYTTARTLLGLAHDGNAPAVLAKTNRFGAPWIAVLLSSVCGLAACFASIYSASVAFTWFVSMTAVSGFISWWGIAFVHLRFRRAYNKQGRNMNELPYHSTWYPFCDIFACVLCILIILGQGYTAFTPQFQFEKFASSYIGLLPAPILYVCYKLFMRSKVVPLDDIDFETGRVTLYDIKEAEEREKNVTWWRRVLYYIL